MNEFRAPYQCAVVEVEPGKFEVVIPAAVSPGGKSYNNIKVDIFNQDESSTYVAEPTSTFESPPGMYAKKDHLNVLGGNGVPSVDRFRGNVGAVVDGLLEGTTPDNPVTLDAIHAALPESQYEVRKIIAGVELKDPIRLGDGTIGYHNLPTQNK